MDEKKVKKPIYKKWWFWVIIGIVVLGIIFPSDDTTDAVDEPETVEVEINVEPNVNEEDGTVLFGVITNLPEDTQMLVDVTNKDGYHAQDSVVILNNGKGFTSEFSDHGAALSGKYTVDVIMSDPAVQPQSVKDVVGEHGENLAGQYIVDGAIGENKLAEATFEFEF